MLSDLYLILTLKVNSKSRGKKKFYNYFKGGLQLGYTIKEVAKKFNLTEHTIRYYDKEGLLPFIDRNKSGNRISTDNDLDWIKLICCLKNTGMQIKKIKQYILWCLEGDETLEIRRQMFIEHREEVLNKIDELKKNLDIIDYKIKFYDTVCNVHVDGNQICFGVQCMDTINANGKEA